VGSVSLFVIACKNSWTVCILRLFGMGSHQVRLWEASSFCWKSSLMQSSSSWIRRICPRTITEWRRRFLGDLVRLLGGGLDCDEISLCLFRGEGVLGRASAAGLSSPLLPSSCLVRSSWISCSRALFSASTRCSLSCCLFIASAILAASLFCLVASFASSRACRSVRRRASCSAARAAFCSSLRSLSSWNTRTRRVSDSADMSPCLINSSVARNEVSHRCTRLAPPSIV